MYIDHLDNTQTGAVEDSQVTAQVPCGPSETRAVGHSRLLHHHDYFISSDFTGVC